MRQTSLGALLALAIACGESRAVADSAASIAPRRDDAPSRADTVVGPARHDSTDRLITPTSIGPIRLGMTLEEARAALPTASFTRASDGEGVALVAVALAPDEKVMLSAGEDDPESAIDWSKPISYMETFDAAFHTPAGIHPGSLVDEVERVHGRTKVITLSEIEAREYIEFASQPAGLTFRLDYSGVFQDHSRTTTAYAPGAKIFSIAISSPR